MQIKTALNKEINKAIKGNRKVIDAIDSLML